MGFSRQGHWSGLPFPSPKDNVNTRCSCICLKRTGLEEATHSSCQLEWQPTPVLLSGEPHGQRSLAGYSPWVTKSQTRLKQLSAPKWTGCEQPARAGVEPGRYDLTGTRVLLRGTYVSGSVSPSLCLTLGDPVDCSPPGSCVHGILQARVLEWVAIPFSRGSSWPRDWIWSPALQADSLPSEPPGKPSSYFVSSDKEPATC